MGFLGSLKLSQCAVLAAVFALFVPTSKSFMFCCLLFFSFFFFRIRLNRTFFGLVLLLMLSHAQMRKLRFYALLLGITTWSFRAQALSPSTNPR